MKSMQLSLLILLLVIAGFLTSCASGINPVESDAIDLSGTLNSTDLSKSDKAGNRDLLAIYDVMIDSVAQTLVVTPYSRAADYHYPLTRLFPNCLQIVNYGFTPNLWADIKITHPVPYSGIDLFDPRVIAIIPANPGVSMNYPTINAIANNATVLNQDGYTRLHDAVAPSIPGNANPFLAYFKHVSCRRWFSSGTGMISDTRRWEIDLTGFGGPIQFRFVVDVSTNYPDPPQQVIDNAHEPVQSSTVIDSGMTQAGGSAAIDVTLIDWQGPDDISCIVECPQLFQGTIQIPYEGPGQNPNEYVFSGSISNSLQAPAGEYNVLIAASDTPTGIQLFREAKAYVDRKFNPVDVTSPWVNFNVHDCCFAGNYVYMMMETNDEVGLHIFDISNPLFPVWINQVYNMDYSAGFYVSDGYAYVLGIYPDYYSYIQIIDIDPPQSAYLVSTLKSLPETAYDIHVSDGYAYVAHGFFGLYIIDVDPPLSPQTVKIVNTQGRAKAVFVSNGYAYVANNSDFHIIDIDPLDSAYIVKSVDTPSDSVDVHVSDGYAYIAAKDNGLYIIDVDPPDSAYLVKSVETPDEAIDVFTSGGYAYVADNHSGLQIIDIEPPETACIIKFVDTPVYATGVHVSGIYAYVMDASFGYHIMNVEDPKFAYILKSFYSTHYSCKIHLSDGYAYVMDWPFGLQIVDVEPLVSAYIVKTLELPGDSNGIYVSGDYAYVANGSAGLQIIDINPPGSAYIVKTVSTLDDAEGVHVSGGYAYVACGPQGLHIIDVEPPELAHIVKFVNTFGSSKGVYVSGGYAYVADSDYSLQIIDIEPLQSAYVVKSVDTPGYDIGVYVSNGYAYVACAYSGLQIIDVEPPESAYLVKSVDTPGCATGVNVYGSYAYVADSSSGLQIIDIEPLDSASIVHEINTPGNYTNDAQVSGDHAYIADGSGGLRIIKLW